MVSDEFSRFPDSAWTAEQFEAGWMVRMVLPPAIHRAFWVEMPEAAGAPRGFLRLFLGEAGGDFEDSGGHTLRRAFMKTQGEIEAAVCQGISHFEQEYMGRGPKDIRAHLIGDLLVVRLQGILTVAEQHLVTTLPVEKGRDLLKQVRSQLVEVARPALDSLVEQATGIKPRSLHHDISTLTGEEVVIFTLADTPRYREAKRK